MSGRTRSPSRRSNDVSDRRASFDDIPAVDVESRITPLSGQDRISGNSVSETVVENSSVGERRSGFHALENIEDEQIALVGTCWEICRDLVFVPLPRSGFRQRLRRDRQTRAVDFGVRDSSPRSRGSARSPTVRRPRRRVVAVRREIRARARSMRRRSGSVETAPAHRSPSRRRRRRDHRSIARPRSGRRARAVAPGSRGEPPTRRRDGANRKDAVRRRRGDGRRVPPETRRSREEREEETTTKTAWRSSGERRYFATFARFSIMGIFSYFPSLPPSPPPHARDKAALPRYL